MSVIFAWIFRSAKPWTTWTPACSIARDHSMFRRSSKRALSSTRQTDCLPSSAHSMSDETSAESSLVRYTVVLIAIVSGSSAAASANASKLARNESYGWWTNRSPRLISSKMRCGVFARAQRGGIIGAHGSSFSSGRSSATSCQRSAWSRRPSTRVDVVRPHAEPGDEPLAQRPGRRGRHLEADGVAEAAAAELRLDRLEQVVGVVRELEVGVAGDAEQRPLGDLHPGEEHGEEVRDDRLERHELLADGDEPVEALGHLHPCEALLRRVRVDREHAQREREPGDVRERLPGPDGERGEHREDLALEVRLELAELLRRSSPRSWRSRSPRRPAPAAARAARARAWRALRASTRSRIATSAWLGVMPVDRADAEVGLVQLEQAGDADHEELVEVLGEDRGELDALEERERCRPRRSRGRGCCTRAHDSSRLRRRLGVCSVLIATGGWYENAAPLPVSVRLPRLSPGRGQTLERSDPNASTTSDWKWAMSFSDSGIRNPAGSPPLAIPRCTASTSTRSSAPTASSSAR